MPYIVDATLSKWEFLMSDLLNTDVCTLVKNIKFRIKPSATWTHWWWQILEMAYYAKALPCINACKQHSWQANKHRQENTEQATFWQPHDHVHARELRQESWDKIAILLPTKNNLNSHQEARIHVYTTSIRTENTTYGDFTSLSTFQSNSASIVCTGAGFHSQ